MGWAGLGQGTPTHRGSWDISRGIAHTEAEVVTMVSTSVANLSVLSVLNDWNVS